MPEIPKFYRYKDYHIIDIEGNSQKIEIRGYRPIDLPYVLKIQQLQDELPQLLSKATIFKGLIDSLMKNVGENQEVTEENIEEKLVEKLSKMDDSSYSEEDLKQLKLASDEVRKVENELMKYSALLAQRGLKRFYYQDEQDYKDAAEKNKLADYLDKLPDVEVDMDHLKNIAILMMRLGAPTRPLGMNDKGKPQKN